jgi:hypothetical protein
MLENLTRYFDRFERAYRASRDAAEIQHALLAHIATAHVIVDQAREIASAFEPPVALDAEFLRSIRESDSAKLASIRQEAADPEMSLLHWLAARGLAMSGILGLCPFSADERDRLFDRLYSETQRCSEQATGRAAAHRTGSGG